MCLYTDSDIHGSDLKQRKAASASRDILVWKVLSETTAKGGKSPYRGCSWRFGVERQAKMKLQLKGYQTKIDIGLHAAINRTAAKRVGYGFCNVRCYPAIIPKGSRLFFGINEHIVATRMIVYPNLAAVAAKHGPIGSKVLKFQKKASYLLTIKDIK